MQYLNSFHSIEEYLRSGRTDSFLILVGPRKGPRIKQILDLAKKAGLKWTETSQAELDRLDSENRGILAQVGTGKAEKSLDLDTWCMENKDKPGGLVLVLDHIEDPRNLGAILRSAEVFSTDLVILPERRAARESELVARTSAGATAWLNLCTVPNLNRAIEQLKAIGFWVYAADMSGENIRDAELPGKTAIVLGGEGSGVSRLLRKNCDGLLAIKQSGKISSLNVSVAAGIFLYEIRSRYP